MIKKLLVKLKAFIKECKRVLRVTKKPTKDEFKNIVKISGIGILIIGLIGFIVQVLKQIFVN
jgi:protein transport protein SEC61 subunit gamma and related proteins